MRILDVQSSVHWKNHWSIPYAPCMEYESLHFPHQRPSFVGKYTMHGANLESRPWPRLKGTEDLGERHLEQRKTIDDGWEMAVEWDQNGII